MNKFEVVAITRNSENVVVTCDDMEEAFSDCIARWKNRRTGGPVYAVIDTATAQRWSYADIMELRTSRRAGE